MNGKQIPVRPIIKAFQWDLARQVERLDFLLRWLPRYAEWGYQELYLHLEDAVEYPSLPGVARSDAFSRRQFGRLVDTAAHHGIKVVPIANLLGHTQYLIKVPELRDLNELRDRNGSPLERGQICPLHPRTPEVAEKLLRDLAPFCTAGKVHVGLDESFHLGKCPRCRADIRRQGLAAHFAAHVRRVHALCGERGLRMGLWGDMLALLPGAIGSLPCDVIVYDWYYHPFRRHPRVELHNFSEVDLAAPLRARGIEYWGCPMNGAFRHEPLPVFSERLANIRSWWRHCRNAGAQGFLVTSWEPQRLAIEMAMVLDAAAASLWLEPEMNDHAKMLACGFARVFGGVKVGRLVPKPPRRVRDNAPHPLQARRWARAALACDKHAFCGYARWEINARWDTVLTREPLEVYEAEARGLGRLCRSLLARAAAAELAGDTAHRLQTGSYRGCPVALAASLAFRVYLAKRDVFVRRAAKAVFQLRAGLRPAPNDGSRRRSPTGATIASLQAEAAAFAAALRAGRAAARIMWRRSRDPRVRGQNELVLDRDAERLREWRRWLRRAASHPGIIWRATPVCGAWQLQFTVENFAPALQKIVVEQQQSDGAWFELHGRHLGEFRAFAARSRTRIRREFSAPVADPAKPLRLAVRGVGQIAISRVELSNGVSAHRPRGWPQGGKKILGRPAPRRGFPKVSWDTNRAELRLVFPAADRA